ncbi:MAG: YicC/YloC family endoribonuclease [Phycisphaerales bacterium]
MTGFGESSLHTEGVHYHLELRSLNNRYFKASIRLPEDLQGLEAELESALRSKISRGALVLVGKFSDTSGGAAHVVNESALRGYLETIERLPQPKNATLSIDAANLLNLPGVLQPSDDEERLDKARSAFMKMLDEAVKKLVAMRTQEGARLNEELRLHQKVIRDRLERVKARAPEVVAEYERRLQERTERLLQQAGFTAEPADVIRDVAAFSEKADIAEEIQRLGAHIEQFSELLSAPDEQPVGRTLDFLAQEMLREANTIGSKCADADIARDVVEIKGAIDRIKEQVQNVE